MRIQDHKKGRGDGKSSTEDVQAMLGGNAQRTTKTGERVKNDVADILGKTKLKKRERGCGCF